MVSRRFAAVLSILSIATAWLFSVSASMSLAPGHWFTKAPLPFARSEVGVTALDGRLYVVGGSGPGDQRAMQLYDPASDTWTTTESVPEPGLNHAGVAALDRKVYVIGGFLADGVATANCWSYDSATGEWNAIAPLPSPRGALSVAVLNGRIHAVGGHDRDSIALHDVYDPSTNTWTSRAPLPFARDHFGLVAVGGKLFALGGRIHTYAINVANTEVYDPVTDKWTELAPMPSRRSGVAAAVYHGQILVIGGEYPRGVFTQNEAYDPSVNAWSVLAPLPEGRHGTGAAVISENLYLPAGGAVNGGARPSNTLWVYAQP